MSHTLASYALKYPIILETRDSAGQVNEEVLRPAGFEVTLRRPRGMDLKIMDRYEGREIAGSMALLAQISNLGDDEVELLDADDFVALGNLLDTPPKSGL